MRIFLVAMRLPSYSEMSAGLHSVFAFRTAGGYLVEDYEDEGKYNCGKREKFKRVAYKRAEGACHLAECRVDSAGRLPGLEKYQRHQQHDEQHKRDLEHFQHQFAQGSEHVVEFSHGSSPLLGLRALSRLLRGAGHIVFL